MIYLPQLLTLGAVLLLACMSPGPDFVAVTSHALVRRRSGVEVAAGIAMACTVWAALAMFGLGLILSQVAWVYEAIRIVGAIYLIQMGARMVWSARRPATALGVAATARDGGSGVRRGLMVGLTNPKSAAFFGSLFVTVLPQGAPLWVQMTTLAIVAGVAFGWFASVAVIFSLGRVRSGYEAIRRPIDAVMGGILIALGLRLAASR